jgi:hypothetical protein
MASCICVNGPESTCPVHGPTHENRRQTARSRRQAAAEASAPVPTGVRELADGHIDGVARYKLEDRRNVAMLQALFYWQMADRRKGSDYVFRAEKHAQDALALQRKLEGGG